MYSIIQAPDRVLRSPTKPVDLSTGRQDLSMPKLKKIIDEMKVTLLSQVDPEGVGLAANQIGLPYRLFLARFDLPSGKQKPKNSPIHVFVNPEILSHSKELQPENKQAEEKAPLEGCLSLPKYYGIVKRWKWVRIKYCVLSIKGALEEHTETFSGFPAVVVQHELDHLSGKIFVERILEQNGKLYKAIKNQRNKDEWEQVEI